MAAKYELPEEVNEERLRTLGMEVEMNTFKTNEVPIIPKTSDGSWLVKIICVGDYTGGVDYKGVFIDDYLQVQPPVKRTPPLDFYFKKMEWRRSEAENPFRVGLQLWDISEYERFTSMTRVYYKGSEGAMVFWGTRRPSSLEGATKWRQDISRKLMSSIPCVLVTDNTVEPEPLEWIGPGKIFESDAALDQFCKDHGFVDHFEIKSRDWESGEKSVFGQAVNCLLHEIFPKEQKEPNVIRFK